MTPDGGGEIYRTYVSGAARYQRLMDGSSRASHASRQVKNERPLVAVVDDNESVRESLPDLLGQCGFDTRAFASAEAFLGSTAISDTGCLVLDVSLPGMSGPELLLELQRRGIGIPIVFITGQNDPAMRPRLLEAGAAACLFKPFGDTELIDAVTAAIRMR
jgi:FixJ family two-component response regulator